MRRRSTFTGFFLAAAVSSLDASPILIDDFSAPGVALTDSAPVDLLEQTTSTVDPGIIGGQRDATLRLLSGGSVSYQTLGGAATYSEDAGSDGQLALLYDANGSGLGTDLTGVGMNDRFRLRVRTDLNFMLSLSITVGAVPYVSTVVVPVVHDAMFEPIFHDVFLQFADFSANDLGFVFADPTTFGNVSSIRLDLDVGLGTDRDIQLDFVAAESSTPLPVPEPSILWLMASGALGLLAVPRRNGSGHS